MAYETMIQTIADRQYKFEKTNMSEHREWKSEGEICGMIKATAMFFDKSYTDVQHEVNDLVDSMYN